MTAPLLIGLLDSGVTPDLSAVVAAGRRFALDDHGEVLAGPAASDRLGHGSTLARIILQAAPQARLLDAQVFQTSIATTPAAVAAGLDWLAGAGARIVNMSFGLRQDRTVLRRACAEAAAAGIILLAAAPARGTMVYPAGYAGVIKVSGDARCAPGEVSILGGRQADFGAHPRPPGQAEGSPRSGGASFAVAHLCGLLAAYLARHPEADQADALAHLDRIARYHGPEGRSAKGPL